MTARRRFTAEPGTTITFRLSRAQREQIELACERETYDVCGRPSLVRHRKLTISEFVKRAIEANLAGLQRPHPKHLHADLRQEAAAFSATLSGWMSVEPDHWHQLCIRRQFEQLIIAIDALLMADEP